MQAVETKQNITQKQIIVVKSVTTNDKNQILLVKRDELGHNTGHNKWELPGGGIDYSENPKETCIRETKEETGYDITIETTRPKITTKTVEKEHEQLHIIFLIYECKLTGGQISLEDEHISQVKWFNKEEIENLETHRGTKEFIGIK